MTRLLHSIGSENVLEHAGTFYVVPQALGAVDMDRDADRSRAGVRCFNTEQAAVQACSGPVSPPAVQVGRMRLVDLDPHWVHDHSGRVVAMTLKCPHCVRAPKANGTVYRLSCFFVPERKFYHPDAAGGFEDQYELLERHASELGLTADSAIIVGCKDGIAWTRTSDDFTNTTVTPSLDASASGDWHGCITNGECA